MTIRNLACVLILAWPQAAPEGKQLTRENDWVSDFAFTPDGRSLVWQIVDPTPAGSDRIQIYDLKSGKVARDFKIFRDPARDGNRLSSRRLAISPDSKLVAGFDDHPDCIQIWDLQTGALQQTLKSSSPEQPEGVLIFDYLFSLTFNVFSCSWLEYAESELSKTLDGITDVSRESPIKETSLQIS